MPATRILLVEDDESCALMYREVLQTRDYEVVLAADGKQGMKELLKGPIHLVITDIYMPEMDGIEFILECRRIDKAIPVIAISGGGMALEHLDMLPTALRIGADRVVHKPFEVAVLLEAVEQVLAGEDAE